MEFILNYKLGFFFVKFDGEIIFVCDSKVIFLKWWIELIQDGNFLL